MYSSEVRDRKIHFILLYDCFHLISNIIHFPAIIVHYVTQLHNYTIINILPLHKLFPPCYKRCAVYQSPWDCHGFTNIFCFCVSWKVF